MNSVRKWSCRRFSPPRSGRDNPGARGNPGCRQEPRYAKALRTIDREEAHCVHQATGACSFQYGPRRDTRGWVHEEKSCEPETWRSAPLRPHVRGSRFKRPYLCVGRPAETAPLTRGYRRPYLTRNYRFHTIINTCANAPILAAKRCRSLVALFGPSLRCGVRSVRHPSNLAR